MFPYTPLVSRNAKKRQLPPAWNENNENTTPRPSKAPRIPYTPTNPIPPFSLLGTPSHTAQDSIPATPTPSTSRTPLAEKKNRPVYRNGYEITKPQTPSYPTYSLGGRRKAFTGGNCSRLEPLAPLDPAVWNQHAQDAGLLSAGQSLRGFQVEAANYVLGRAGDLCVIAPTGAGKSFVWTLPLLAQDRGISLVIVPYTSLGYQGVLRSYGGSMIKSTFLHGKNKHPAMLERLARDGGRQIVYICAEMLESPTMAPVLHSDSFKAQLSAIYIDEAHTAHESSTWRD
ncbi:hypothetical protein D9611_014742 [Ephemerocybe angulata]|uniref:DNA 3'-5' helicase n=1 Tax=Ephemerocybe angulata TaxID=980116 RepID=A0A8H5B7Z0_9AGAR|nr:hypothetical protein D9611_014742 [Tulosesus angulatus]